MIHGKILAGFTTFHEQVHPLTFATRVTNIPHSPTLHLIIIRIQHQGYYPLQPPSADMSEQQLSTPAVSGPRLRSPALANILHKRLLLRLDTLKIQLLNGSLTIKSLKKLGNFPADAINAERTWKPAFED